MIVSESWSAAPVPCPCTASEWARSFVTVIVDAGRLGQGRAKRE